MKRFWVFRCDEYYPSGGMHDLLGTADTLEEAKAMAAAVPDRDMTRDLHAHIFDTESEKVVWEDWVHRYDRRFDKREPQ